MALGALWVILWQGPARFAGVVPVVLAFVLWGWAERPSVLISSDGKLVGLETENGRALSAPKGAGFVAQQWLENDGDMADQGMAAARAGFDGPPALRQFLSGGWRIAQIKGMRAEAQLVDACKAADLVVVGARLVGKLPANCVVIDEGALRTTGALALWPKPEGGFKVAQTKTQHRLWTGRRTVEPDRSALIALGQMPKSQQVERGQ